MEGKGQEVFSTQRKELGRSCILPIIQAHNWMALEEQSTGVGYRQRLEDNQWQLKIADGGLRGTVEGNLFSPKIWAVFAQEQLFFGHNDPFENSQTKMDDMCCDWFLSSCHKSPLVPPHSTTYLRSGPDAQNGPKSVQRAPNPEWAAFWATCVKIQSRGHQVHPQPPTLYGFNPQNHSTRSQVI